MVKLAVRRIYVWNHWESGNLFEKLISFAENGNGRRLLNTLAKEIHDLTPSKLNEVLKAYCEIGLPKEVDLLKKRRGILSDDQYNDLAEKVRVNCCHERYDEFKNSLRNLLTCGIKMNPAKMDVEDQM